MQASECPHVVPALILKKKFKKINWIDFVPRCLSSPRQTPKRPCTEHHSEKKNCIAMMYCKQAKVNYVPSTEYFVLCTALYVPYPSQL
jgi:hypothetical protein